MTVDPKVLQELEENIQKRLDKIGELTSLFDGNNEFWTKLDKDLSDATKRQNTMTSIENELLKKQRLVIKELEDTQTSLIDRIKLVKDPAKKQKLTKYY